MGLFEGILDGTASYDLDCGIDWVLQDYPEDFETFWGLNSGTPPEGMSIEEWTEYQSLYHLADTLAHAAQQLIRPKSLREDLLALPSRLTSEAAEKAEKIQKLLGSFRDQLPDEMFWQLERAFETTGPSDPRTKKNFFRACLQIQAARLFLGWPAQLAARMEVLSRYLIRSPSERARAYLARVAECYIRGMDAEFSVMCRAVLDAALCDLYSDEIVKARMGGKGRIGLESRIGTGYSMGHLNDVQFDAAMQIKRSGDDAIHLAPGLETNPDGLLENLYTVLVALEPHQAS